MQIRGNNISISLTNRELELIQYIAKGLTNKEIGEELYMSKHAVKAHVSAIIFKQNAKNRTEAVYIALKRKIID